MEGAVFPTKKEDWVEKTIGELATSINSGNRAATKYRGTGDFPAITSGDLRSLNDISIKECKTFINKDFVRGVLCEPGDILVIWKSMSKGITGKSYVYEGKVKCIVANEIYIIKHNQNPRYLIHAMNSFLVQSQIRKCYKEKSESEMLNLINMANLKKIKLSLPPIHVQEKIADYLDGMWNLKNQISWGLDKLLHTRTKQYEYYKELILSSEVNKWGFTTLAEIATDFYLGVGVSKEQLGTGDYPAIKCGDVNSGLSLNFTECMSFVDHSLINNPKYFEYGDILISAFGNSTKKAGTAIAYLGNEKCLAGKGVYVLKHNQNPQFLAHMLSSKYCRNQIEKFCRGSAIVNFFIREAKQLQIPLPPLEEQERIVAKLDALHQDLATLKEKTNILIYNRNKQYRYHSSQLLSQQ